MKQTRLNILLLLVSSFITTKSQGASGDIFAHHSGWDQWSQWSNCNVACGTGVAVRERACLEANRCQEQSVQFKTCNSQNCTEGQESHKVRQCSSHDGEDFRGNTAYRWKPYSLRQEDCKVVCHPEGHWFYNIFPEQAANGTICNDKGTAVCILGECKKFGCDGVVGSHGKMDMCGVCKGDNTTCTLVKFLFDNETLNNGYNRIATIPIGATHIKITQTRDRSRNYLALREKGGSYFLNGNRRLERGGGKQGAGTVFHYHRRRHHHCPGECLVADGPTKAPVDIMLLSFGLNIGVEYSFAIKNEDVDKHIGNQSQILPSNPARLAPTINGHRTGTLNVDVDIGPQIHTPNTDGTSNTGQRKPGYTQSFDFMDKMKERMGQRNTQNNEGYPRNPSRSGDFVPTYNRNAFEGGDYPLSDKRRPSENSIDEGDNVFMVSPNKSVIVTGRGRVSQSYYQWRYEGYSECSASCGSGVRTPILICTAFQSEVNRRKCDGIPIPGNHRSIPCNLRPCETVNRLSRWEASDWSPCSRTCGFGHQRRTVRCVQDTVHDISVTVAEYNCNHEDRPTSYTTCENRSCFSWNLGTWGRCSTSCGSGMRSRSITCIDSYGRAVSTDLCSEPEPASREACQNSPCSGYTRAPRRPFSWYTSEWTQQCSVDCGEGDMTRNVVCLREDGYVTNPLSCNSTRKPTGSKPCKEKKGCGVDWFTGPWGTCNVTCGRGAQTRSVVCVSKDSSQNHLVIPDFNCEITEKPDTTQPCQGFECTSSWYTSEWNQCSVTCGSGTRSRDVKCLDSNQRPSASCHTVEPDKTEVCNMESCFTPPTVSSGDCVDKYSHCVMVLRTSLCEYKYYKDLCCKSCSQSTLS